MSRIYVVINIANSDYFMYYMYNEMSFKLFFLFNIIYLRYLNILLYFMQYAVVLQKIRFACDFFFGCRALLFAFPTFCHFSFLNELRNILHLILSVCTT